MGDAAGGVRRGRSDGAAAAGGHRGLRAGPGRGNHVITLEAKTVHSALRKMGNSTGVIVPRTVLREAGLTTGVILDLVVEQGRIIATPVERTTRAGWAEAAAAIATAEPDAEAALWQGFGNADDAALEW